MAIYVYLDKPLISKVLINENLQRIEYKSLSVVCFSCGCYGHNKDSCPHVSITPTLPEEVVPLAKIIQENTAARKGEFCPWMLVERKIKCISREPKILGKFGFDEKSSVSRFQSLKILDFEMLKENPGKEFTPDLKRHGKGIMTKFGRTKAANGQGVGPSNVFEIRVTARAGPSSPTEGFRISLDSNREVHLIAASGKSVPVSLPIIPVKTEVTEVNVGVKEGILDAKNHTAVVFKENTHPNLSGEAVGGNLSISKNHPIMVNGRGSGVKAFGSEGGWKINKTLKGPGNRFKATESSRVSFAETMKMTTNLISIELDRQVVKNLSTEEGEQPIFIAFVYGSLDRQKMKIPSEGFEFVYSARAFFMDGHRGF
ncbi:hypothetical protein Gorai_003315 [Gossypium raimondii]|uniref:CCHC-type domain-containing protein n=1 Tax=Gossypium raimondii TaxID=29730 RepID=A0A7J8QPE1_GOSRA|nr:hypothetical protein [Gossypium raimondii]